LALLKGVELLVAITEMEISALLVVQPSPAHELVWRGV